MTEKIISFKHVVKSYALGSGEETAINRVSFDLKEGEMVFLTGHSGAGKSTLLKLILMLERPCSGRIELYGQDISKLPKRKIPGMRRTIGFIAQNPKLLQHQTAYENVALPLIINGFGPADAAKRVRPALSMVGLLNKQHRYPSGLSCGEQQRLGIARAVVTKPSILLADEPTGNLDPSLSFEIMQLFEKLNQVGVTVMIATHDLSLIGRIKHLLMTLEQGRLV